MAHDATMPTPLVVLQFRYGFDQVAPQRIEVDVCHKFQQVRILITYNGLIAVLKEVAGTVVA